MCFRIFRYFARLAHLVKFYSNTNVGSLKSFKTWSASDRYILNLVQLYVRNPAGLLYLVVKTKGDAMVGVIRKYKRIWRWNYVITYAICQSCIGTSEFAENVMTDLRHHICDLPILYRQVRIRTSLVRNFPEWKGNAHSGCDMSRMRRQAHCELLLRLASGSCKME